MEKVRGFEVAKGFENEGINLPMRKTKCSAGYDVEAAEDTIIPSFKSGMKNNWKKGLVSMLIGIVLTPVLLLAIGFYLNFQNGIGTIIGAVFIVLLFALILVQNFVYTLIVSTDLKLGKIYKNAIIFMLIRFVPCLGISLVIMLFYVIIPFILLMSASYLTLGIFMFLYSFLVISWVQYFLSFYTGRLIEKYVAVAKEE